MDRTKLLEHLGLSNDDLNNLLLKFRVFYASLTDKERAVVDRLLPKFKHAAALFGGDISRDDLKRLLAPPPPPPPPPGIQAPGGGTAGAFGQNGVNNITNGNGDGNGDGNGG